MAHYKETINGQNLFLTVDLSKQIVKGTYEYTLTRLIDNKLDLSIFDCKYNNDYTGAAAIEPRILLKVITYCYSLGVISSRKIAKMCKMNMVVCDSLIHRLSTLLFSPKSSATWLVGFSPFKANVIASVLNSFV